MYGGSQSKSAQKGCPHLVVVNISTGDLNTYGFWIISCIPRPRELTAEGAFASKRDAAAPFARAPFARAFKVALDAGDAKGMVLNSGNLNTSSITGTLP